MPGTLIPLHQACCSTKFWLAVVHTVALSSHEKLLAVNIFAPQPLSLHRDSISTRWAVALHPTTTFSNRTAQILLRACDTHSKPTPTMSPVTRMTLRVSPPDTSSVTQPHHLQLRCFFFYFFPSPPPSSLSLSRPSTRCSLGPETQRERDQPLSAPSCTEKKVLRSRSRTASCTGLVTPRWLRHPRALLVTVIAAVPCCNHCHRAAPRRRAGAAPALSRRNSSFLPPLERNRAPVQSPAWGR